MIRKVLIMLIMFACALATQAQTLNVRVGEVLYQVPAKGTGYMEYSSGGEVLTIRGKALNVSEIDEMYIDRTSVVSNTVNVTYNGTSAEVVVAGNCMAYLDIVADGSSITIEQSDDLDEEITYTLSGTSSNGTFYMDGSLKATLVLNSLTLTSTGTSAPINIRNGKRIKIDLEGTSTIKDSTKNSGKGALMVNGHSEFTGSGTLNLYGYANHAYWADEYIELKKSFTGTINVLYAAADGINVNQYFHMKGGTINISGTKDDGLQVSADDDESGWATIADGSLTITNTVKDTKSFKAEGVITIDGGTITVTNSGTGEKNEGIESKAELYMNGGTVYVYAYDDAINSASNMYIYDGDLTVISKNNDGLDANKNIYIYGGTVRAYGGKSPECSIDALERCYVYLYGGTVLGIGGSSITSTLSGSQHYVYTSGSVSASSTIALKSGSTELCSFTVPSNYSSSSSSSNGGGGMGGMGGGSSSSSGYQILISHPDISKNSSYTLVNGSKSTTVTGK